ncbi:hypothetical protein B0H13DRAFT_1734694 [Mycena leptocephala]|nr:hypothetical protein B0H13DRAFT_1734694 [Mycena leptocephala]
MPLFTSASELQINGGNFIDHAGDINIVHTTLSTREDTDRLDALGTQCLSRHFSGVARSSRQIGAEKMLPYDISRRPQILRSETSRGADSEISFAGPSNVHHLASLQHLLPTFFQPHRAGSYKSNARDAHGIHPDPEKSIEYPTQRSHDRYLLAVDSEGETSRQPHFPLDGLPCEPHIRIDGGTFIGGSINHIQHHGESGLYILQRVAAGDAFHDSAERYPQPKCDPETRKEMLEGLYKWASETDSQSSLLWLHGPAGAGKSAIAQSFCQMLEAEGRLGASFFFKRGHASRGAGARLFPTIAYQLALCQKKLGEAICNILEPNPSIIDRAFSIQLQKLIIEPCLQCRLDRTLVIVVDGLDECQGKNVQQEILHSLARAIHQTPFPLRFFVASRPEPHIQDIFAGPLKGKHQSLNVPQAFSDVKKYLLNEFARIHQEHRATMAMVSHPWPSPEIIRDLVQNSSGYFIYASTVIKFIDDKSFRPTERLAVITGMAEPRFGVPFATLDQLYTQILSEVHAQPLLLMILAVIAAKILLPAPYIEQLLELESGDVRLALHGLHSVLIVPEDDEDCISFHHASFRDFIQDAARAGAFYVGGGCTHRAYLSHYILKTCSYMYDDTSQNRRGHASW